MASEDYEFIVDVENYSFKFPRSEKPVLNNVNLKIKPGECVLLMGKSGCGKTLLCISLNGVIPHLVIGEVSGKVVVAGKDVHKTEVKDMAKDVGIVFQNPDWQLCNIRVEDEVAFGLENLCFDPAEIRRRIDEALDFVGLENFHHRQVMNLSGGEKQRLAIASMLAMRPKILVLDAPTSNLDPVGTEEVCETVSRIKEETNTTLLIVEHNVDEIMHHIDKMVVMGVEGNVAYEGPPRELLDIRGNTLWQDLGLWLPQVSVMALELRNAAEFSNTKLKVPITVEEAADVFRKYVNLPFKCEERKPVEGSEDIILAEDVHYSYPNGVQALKGVDLKIKKGDLAAIVGQNGSGKSTFSLNCIGIYKPTSGHLEVAGFDINKTSPVRLARAVSYVFQYPEHQFVTPRIFDEVAYSLKILGGTISETEINKRVEDELEKLQLLELKDRHPYSLSMGQMRRLSVAAMLVTKPQVIFLDEPTYGQDRHSVKILMDRMDQLHDEGTTVIFITHNMKLVAEFAHSVHVFKSGKVIFSGGPRELFAKNDILAEAHLSPPPVSRVSNLIENCKYVLSIPEFIENMRRR